MSFKIAKAIVPINRAEIHMMVVDVILSLLELLLDLSKSLNYLLSRYGVKAACQILTLEIPVRVEGTAARSSLVEFHPDLEKF